MVILRPVNLRWIRGAADDARDLCAHGEVTFRIDDDVLLEPTADKDFTVSAAALYLLRTLSVPHTKDAPVGDHLFPCCGFSMFDLAEQEDVVIRGCPSGEDFVVLHGVGAAGVVIPAGDGRQWKVEWPEWRAAVFGFTDSVSDFYAACSPKQPGDEEDGKGFDKFVSEWERRRGQKLGDMVLRNK